MGLDILDMVFRLERCFGIKISRNDLDKMFRNNDPPDVAIGELFDFVSNRADRGGVIDSEMDADPTWTMFQHAIPGSLGIDPEEISKGRWLIRDLGAS